MREAPKPGVYHDIPHAEYLEWDAVSYSALKVLRDKTPAHLFYQRKHPTEPTEAMALGSAVHAAVLEPEIFAARYAVAPDVDRRTKDGKAEWADFCNAYPNATILKAADFAVCIGIRERVERHPKASALLNGMSEISLTWIDGETGLVCKARLDHHNPGPGVVVDLKTTKDASPREFERSIFKFGYYMQAGFYLEGARACGLEANHFAIVAVETVPPFEPAVYRITNEASGAGMDQVRPLLNLYSQCKRSGDWPGYPHTVQDIAVPTWAWSQIEGETE